MYNKIILLGNLGRDPELRHTNDGTAVTTLNVATSEQWTSNSGEDMKRTAWWHVSVWGKSAEAAAKYLKSGSRVLVECTIQPDPETGNPRVYKKNDGSAGASLDVRAVTVKFADSRPSGGADDDFASDPPDADLDEDSIPF